MVFAMWHDVTVDYNTPVTEEWVGVLASYKHVVHNINNIDCIIMWCLPAWLANSFQIHNFPVMHKIGCITVQSLHAILFNKKMANENSIKKQILKSVMNWT